MQKKEKSIVAILFLTTLASFLFATQVNYWVSQLDSAMMVGNIESTFVDGRPISQINASALKAISTVIVQEADVVCAQDLREDRVETVEMFRRHAYVFLYALAPLNAFVSAPVIAATLHAVAFIGLLLAAYLYLRTEKLPIMAALVFVALTVAHPAWSASAFGQFYPDRFFILVGALYVWLLHSRLVRDEGPAWGLLLPAIMAATLTERAAIMTGVSTLGLLVLYRDWRTWSRRDIPLVGLAVAILVYALLYMKLVQSNSDYGSFSSQVLSFFNTFQDNERFRLGLQNYLWVNLPYLILALFEWRMALLAFGAMLPNMVGSIGGAEKTGWATHYHSMYFPFLIAAASMGFVRLYRLVEPGRKGAVLYCVVVLVALYVAMLSPFPVAHFWEIKAENIRENALLKTAGIVADLEGGSSIRINADLNKAVAEVIPANASVSAPEGMMPALLGKGRVLHYYPLGIGNADYLIVSFTRDDEGVLKLFGAFSYLGEANRNKLDACLSARIGEEYQLVKTVSPGAATSYGLAVFKRLTRE